jgi:fluoride exporter
MINVVAVAVGGALGAVCRYGANGLIYPLLGNKFPLGTFSVNVVGSFLIGVFYVLIVEKGILPAEWRNVLMIGFLGAFTTFSAFSLDTLALLESGRFAVATIYVVSSLLVCILATFAAIALTRLF